MLSHGRGGRYERFVRLYGAKLRRLGKLWRLVMGQLFLWRLVQQRRRIRIQLRCGVLLERIWMRRVYNGPLLSRIFKRKQSVIRIWSEQLQQCAGKFKLYGQFDIQRVSVVVQCRILRQQRQRKHVVRRLWQWELLYRRHASRDMRQHGQGQFRHAQYKKYFQRKLERSKSCDGSGRLYL